MKIIALYLPQFHQIPENDEWWGPGFTEWTNTKKAKPLFKNHYQPQTPLNDNYYDLLDSCTQENQVKIARKYGIDAFCYYHYWFKNGKKLLEKPLENMLNNKNIDIPFCICWANENWSRRWDGGDEDILMAQDYDDDSNWEKHFYYLLDFFKDERYLKDDGHPILLIYKPQEIPNLQHWLKKWNELAIKEGILSIKFIVQYPQVKKSIEELFDYVLEFEPEYTATSVRINKIKSVITKPLLFLNISSQKFLQSFHFRTYKKYSYKLFVNDSMKRKLKKNHIPCVFPGWDNTARRGNNAIIYYGSSPKLFFNYLVYTMKKNKTPFIFINAWNEWAEGAHLEPDKKYGYEYLDAVKKAKDMLK